MAQTLFTVSFSLSLSFATFAFSLLWLKKIRTNKKCSENIFIEHERTVLNGFSPPSSHINYSIFMLCVCVCGAVVLYVQRNDDAPKEEKERKSI